MVNDRTRTGFALSAAVCCFLAEGCGSNPYELVDVSGEVTCNGKPAIGGIVIFEPIDAPDKTGRPPGEPGGVSRGMVNEDGSFSLVMDPKGQHEARDGALIGPHRVTFLPPRTEPATMDPQDSWLPEEEQAQLKEELAAIPVFEPLECGITIAPGEVEVVLGGDNTFQFTLSGEPVRQRRQVPQGASD